MWLDGVTHEPMQDGGSWTGGPPKGVLHTVEGSSWPGYAGGTIAPHFTVMPISVHKELVIRQHVSLERAARALRNRPGGVQTNRDHAIQIELVGTCDPSRPDLFNWPLAPNWAIGSLAAFMRRLERLTGIKPYAMPLWKPFPSSYGTNNGVRLSLSAWDAFAGWCGHQHVPENDHGDPGALPAARLVNISEAPPPVGEYTHSTAPVFPLAQNQYFGIKSSHNGYNGATDRGYIRQWQARMRARGWRIDVDGLFGPMTEHIAKQFQAEKHLDVDGLVGPITWGAAWTAPIT